MKKWAKDGVGVAVDERRDRVEIGPAFDAVAGVDCDLEDNDDDDDACEFEVGVGEGKREVARESE